MDIDALARKIQDRMSGSGFGRTIRIDLKGEGSILIDGESVSTAGSGGEADCVVTVSKDDLASIVSGESNPMAAFMSGKMKVEGDMGVAMALSQAL